MNIRLLGWQASGLRCPDMRIDLGADSADSQVHLIQMPNGTGKTTTLNLLNACLSGCAREWGEEDVMKYRRLRAPVDEGKFIVRLQVDDDLITFELILDFADRTCRYRTSNAEDRGVRDGWKPPSALKRYLKKEFIEMVVFDGELASRLLDRNYTQAERAIDALCQLDFFSHISSAADSIWRNAKLDGALEEGQIQSIRRRIAKLAGEKDELENECQKARRKLRELQAEKSKLEENKADELGRHAELKARYEAAEHKVTVARNEREQSMSSLLSALQNPVNAFPRVRTELLRFKDGLDKARLPESTSRQFFEEIVENDFCICGTEFTSVMRDHVREKMGDYLSDESTGVLNLLKDSIVKFGSSHGSEPEQIQSLHARLRESHSGFYFAEQERSLAKMGYDGPGAIELSQIEQKIGQLVTKIELLEGHLETKIPLLQKKKDELVGMEEELAEAQNSKHLKEKVSVLTTICKDVVEIVRSDVKAQLLAQCNEDIRSVLLDNPVEISEIDGAITLVNQSAASVGQTLAVGYVFLSRLFSYASHSFPFVVDSPVGPLDNSVREQVGALIPLLNRQFIAFTISSERVGFLTGLESKKTKGIEFITVHRSLQDMNVASVTQGRDAFLAFHADKE